MILEPKENALRMKKKVERRLDRIPDVRYPGGMSAEKNSGCETSGWNVDEKDFGCEMSGGMGDEEF